VHQRQGARELAAGLPHVSSSSSTSFRFGFALDLAGKFGGRISELMRASRDTFEPSTQSPAHAARADDALAVRDERRWLADDGPARAERPRALREQPGQRTPSGGGAANVQLRPLEL